VLVVAFVEFDGMGFKNAGSLSFIIEGGEVTA
jgi:hypothetical protein